MISMEESENRGTFFYSFLFWSVFLLDLAYSQPHYFNLFIC